MQQENEELKESLEEHQSVLELIMKKYRQQLSQIIMLKQQQEENENIFKINLMQVWIFLNKFYEINFGHTGYVYC